MLCPCSPVCVTPDPIRGEDNVLVLCEVMYPDGTPHETNTRSKLEALITDKVRKEACLFGFEQASALLCIPIHNFTWQRQAQTALWQLCGSFLKR